MSSSRSIAAARARRSNEPAQPVNGSRPVTSIGSQAAFAQMPPPPSNIRVARGIPPPQQMPPQQQMYQQQMQGPPPQMYQQPGPPPPPSQLPFSKLSISDAIGLITLRLGRVEQYIIELDHSDEHGPDNVPLFDNSIVNNIVSRLDSLEKREPSASGNVNGEELTLIKDEIKTIHDNIKKLNDELVKTNLSAAKHSEQMLRFDRDFVENKDILKTLLIKFDVFVKETNDKFMDYENAIVELEKNFPQTVEGVDGDFENSVTESTVDADSTNIMTVDLKNIIKQELANEDI
jgi:hypothetical protein